ncbi:MAG: hypothetical protein LBD35_07515 [Prevotellaceae bacterium]|jgi:hypothetical protein|nr:hypothetical protein [Prevotellaceae bacterium]
MELENNKISRVRENDSDEISLKELILKIREIWSFLLGRWIIICIFGFGFAALGLVYSLMSEPSYIANMTFSVIDKGSSVSGLSALAGQFGFGMGASGGSVFSGANMIELLQSRNLIERTLLSELEINGKRDRLINYYREINPPDPDDIDEDLPVIEFPIGLDRKNFSRDQDSLIAVFGAGITEGALSIEKGKKDVSIISMSFVSSDELFAKLFTETLMRVVTEFYIQTKTQNIKVNLESMERRADSMKTEYIKALTSAALFSDENLNPARKIMLVEQQKHQTTIQLTGTAYAELVKNIEIMKLDLVQQTPLIQIIDEPIMPLEIKRFGKLKGLVLGGFLGGFLIVGWLLAGYFYKRIMESE